MLTKTMNFDNIPKVFEIQYTTITCKFKLRWFVIAKDLLINEKIGNKSVRVIDDVSGPIGIMNSVEALQMARDKGLDLVEISPNANPPVCKIIDYGKFCFEKKKKEREMKRKKVKNPFLRQNQNHHTIKLGKTLQKLQIKMEIMVKEVFQRRKRVKIKNLNQKRRK